MYLSLLLFCTCGTFVNSDDSGDSDDEKKFIDLLPEEEKDAFIESVARRLMTGVKTRDSRYKSDEEVSDEALNQHSEYVRKVLQEETGNLRRNSKVEIDSEEKLKVQGLDDDRKPTQIQDNNDKNHIDLTLRGHRRKRNENEEFIPVKTVYDEENVTPLKTESNTEGNKDEYQDKNTKSKEKADENSTTEDIQVRGLRPHPRSKTRRPSLRDATIMGDFEPEETHEDASKDNVKPKISNEHSTTHNGNHEDASVDNIESKTHAGHRVTISAETTDDVKSADNGFTESIFESQESVNELNSHSNESVETVTESTTTATKTTVNVTTDHATTTTQNVVTETSTVGNQSQTTTDKQQYLRANADSGGLEKELESSIDETQKDKNNDNEKADEKAADVAMEDSIVEVNNNNLGNLSNGTNLRSENKSNTRNEQDDAIKNKNNVGNKDDSFETNKSVEKDVVVLNIDNTTTTEASPRSRELESNKEVEVVNDSDTKPNKNSAEGKISNENNGFVSTTENNKLDDKTHYVTEQVNSSYVLNNLRSDLNSKTIHFIDIDMVPIELNKTQSDDIEDKNKTVDTTFLQFEGILENSNKVLTTTEKNYENMSKNGSMIPNYKIYYSSYLPDNATIDNGSNNTKSNFYRDEEDDKLEYQSQRANLKKFEKTLRQGFSHEEDEDESKETKPKLLQSSGKIKEYIVFEIPADKAPFVPTKSKPKKQLKPKEQPYYVPIYNYSPNNAYYNAYNRLGPNEDDNHILGDAHERNDNSDVNFGPESLETFYIDDLGQPDGHRIFKYKSKKHKEPIEKLRVVHNSNSKIPLMIKNPKVTEIFFNPDEYLDVDYYFERSRNPDFKSRKKRKQKRYHNKKALKSGGNIFPDSEESLHPFHSMVKDDVKSHIHAVRQMLYQQKLFGFLPDETSQKPHYKNATKGKDHHVEYDYNHNHRNNESHDHHYHHHEHTSFRASNLSDYLLLLPNGKQKADKQNQQDISVDYYFGIHNKESYPEFKRSEDFIRASKAGNPKSNNKKIVYKEKKTMLTDLIGEIKRLRRTAEAAKKLENKNFEKEMAEWKKRAGTVKDILGMTDSSNVFPTLEKLKELNLTLMRRKDRDDAIEVYVNVLKDMIKMENRALNKFDWLGSTVDILGAVEKLKYITEHHHQDVHPSDLQLLKYVLFLYKSSKSSLEDLETEEPMLRAPKKKHALPRNKKRKKAYLTAGLLNRVWLYRDRNESQSGKNRKNQNFLIFLDDLKNSLFDLHYALKHIAMVTKFMNQQWFQNLKSLYLKRAEKKEILELLLHIFTSRLLELIEESAGNGLQDGYLEYVKQNEKQVERTKDEFVFVLKLLNEMKNYNKNDSLDSE